MDKHQKKQLKKYITWAVLALMVVVLAVMPLIAGNTAPADGPQASLLRTTAENRTIQSQIIGGGLLSSEATEALTIPEEVKLTEYLVGNGDSVKQGDPIARVDKVSVQSALVAVQETLDYLSEEIADAGTDSDEDEVKAHAGGLVKILYGQKGDSVREVMLEHGALAVLSLDGRMAVDLACTDDLKTGSTLLVTLSDGTEINGKVESCAAGTLTVSVKDDDYAIGEEVIVTTQAGASLGSGTLYIHNAWNAAAYYGTISKVNVKEGATVSAGKSLFTLEVSDYSTQFQILIAQRQEYEELMYDLFQMYDSGVISAPCDGVVTGVDEAGAFLLAAGTEQAWQVQLLSNNTQATTPTWTVTLLRNFQPNAAESNTADWLPDGQWPSTGDDSTGSSDPSEPADPSEPTYTGRIGKVTSVEADSVTLLLGNDTYTGTLRFFGGLALPDESSMTSMTYTGATYSGIAAGDIVVYTGTELLKVTAGSGGSAGDGTDTSTQQPTTGSMGGMMGGMGGTQVPSFEPYSLETLTVASVTSQEKMSLEISIDEQDIAKLYTGQEATITVEALTGQSFPAVVTSISNTGTNEGGSSKFTAKLTLSKSGDMLPGMNASAFLTLDAANEALSIPVSALVEQDGKTIVYTACNEKEGILEKPVEVTTGLSDGEYVEILSGLSAGDTIWYAYYDTPEISNIPVPGGFGF
ncbi:MAG: HlyD family efflux transporter periplasmic adaptor subunit [Faecousia sp.]